LPNVGPYIYDVSISGFTRSSIYIYDISSLRVNNTAGSSCYKMLNSKLISELCIEKNVKRSGRGVI